LYDSHIVDRSTTYLRWERAIPSAFCHPVGPVPSRRPSAIPSARCHPVGPGPSRRPGAIPSARGHPVGPVPDEPDRARDSRVGPSRACGRTPCSTGSPSCPRNACRRSLASSPPTARAKRAPMSLSAQAAMRKARRRAGARLFGVRAEGSECRASPGADARAGAAVGWARARLVVENVGVEVQDYKDHRRLGIIFCLIFLD
jgi:hypothetical protein